ncbi:MAG: PKD-like domain-containing protein, partial [Bacteroidales bacterium]
MKKLFIKIISILAIFMLNISIISAQQITLPNSNACLNDTTIVPINFSNIDSLAALTLYISYDTAVLTYVGFDNVNTITSGIMCGVPTVGYNAWKVVISWIDNTLNGVNLVSEKLCDLKFKYKGGNSNLTFLMASELSKPDGINVIIPTYSNGSVSPLILSQPISTQICEGLQTNFSVATASGSTYQWQVLNGTQWFDLQNNTTYSGVNTNSLQINKTPYSLNNKNFRCLVTKNCTESSSYATLTVYPKPLIVINNDTTICVGNSVIISGSGSTGSGTLIYSWDQGLGLGITHTVTPSLSSTYYLTVTGSNNCTSIDSVVVFVNQFPSPAGIITGTTTLCKGQNGVIYTVPSINNATSYIWTIPTGVIGTSTTNSIAVNYSNTAVSGNITVHGSNACGVGNSSSFAITVNPTPAVSNNATATTCSGTSPNIALTSSTPSNFAWTIGTITGSITGATASSGASINQVLINPNITNGSVQYIVTPTSTTGSCVGNPTTITITVNPIPAVTNNATATTCSGTSPNIALTSSTPSNFAWTIGTITGSITGATASSGASINQVLINPNITNGSVQYIVTPTSTTGSCVGNPFTIAVTVNSAPSVNNNITATTCSGTSPNIALTASVSSNFAWT